MSEFPFHFAQPGWGMGLWVWLVVVLVLVVLERRGSDAVDRLVGVTLQERLVDRPASWRRWARIVFLSLSGVLMLIALMQPQWGMRFVATPRVGAEIMIAIDVSRSMLADDAKPTRLDRAKAEVSDLLGYLKDDYVGLIAFAGRASVLSPMTPDKSFLRLALDSAGPHSVSRGGTRLAEPIRRAIAGMGEPGPAQRALILITDGEDHDSFALDAAKAAAAAGIKIIAIGFGDEGGSEIYVRDRKTGARTLVRDGDGNPVVSRLDGDLLRELALATDGAFVPAGTGVLDLASIYDAHISRLTRGQLDEKGRPIRDEIYQVFVLLALICLVAAVVVASGRGDEPSSLRTRRKRSRYEEVVQQSTLLALLFGGLLFAAAPLPAMAQLASQQASTSEETNPASPAIEESASDAPRESSSAEEDPRVRFNRANESLGNGETEAATSTYRAARRDAVDDLELRYAATYNLGLAASARADALRAENPAAALEALYEAADWFHEATGMRPKDRDPRQNLDVTLRKALILADEIASRDEQGVEAVLEELIEDQRKRVREAAGLLEEIVRSGELDAAEILRPLFHQAATAQRLIVSDADTLADRIERERETLLRVAEEERTPEDGLRIEQLEGVLIYVDSAIERMGQTRRQLRQRRAERAYRRGARALSELKRARDQLRSPVDQIGVLLGEVSQVAQATAALGAKGIAAVPSGGEAAPAFPAFLTPEWNEAESAAVQARVEELAGRLGSAAERAAASIAAGAGMGAAGGQPPGGPPGQAPPNPAEQEALREALAESAPLVAGAAESLARATEKIAGKRFGEALGDESEAGEALVEAQELFFDLRQLLDATYDDEQRVASLAIADEAAAQEVRAEFAPLVIDLQGKNLNRARRLQGLLEREETTRIAALEAQAAEAAGGAPANPASPNDGDPAESERQRFELAGQLLALAEGAMLETRAALGEGRAGGEATAEGAKPEWPAVGEAAARSAGHLDSIRTLFFTLAEHVRKLALDQVDFRDRAQDTLALANASPSDETKGRADALAPEQRSLDTRGGAIADALFAQAESMPGDEGAGPKPSLVEEDDEGEGTDSAAADANADPDAGAESDPVDSEEPTGEAQPESERDRIRRAAEHVAIAQLAMREAGEALEAEEKATESIQEEQARAVEELQKALALLSPPPPPPSEDQDQEQQQDQEQNEDGEQKPEDSDQQDQQQQGEAPQPQPQAGEDAEEEMGDPSQLLQGVRDREAERRRDQEEDEMRRRSVPVEKDW